MEQKPALSVPYHRNRVFMAFTGLLAAALGFSMDFVMVINPLAESFIVFLLTLPYYLILTALGIFGLKLLLESLLVVHFVPEGIAVTCFGKALRLYPVEQIAQCCLVCTPNFHWIGVSGLSPEQLVKRREQRLRKSWISKSSVDHKMRRAGWQTRFLREQLRTEARKAFVYPLAKNFFWMEYAPERRHFLRTMYPQLSWLNSVENTRLTMTNLTEKHEYVFCRGLCNEGGKLGLAFVCLLLTVPFWIVALSMGDMLTTIFSCLGLTVLFGAIWILGEKEYDEFWVYPDKLRITRGKRILDEIPAEEVRTIVKGSYYQKGHARYYLAISRLTERELADKIAGKCRSREQKMMLRACGQVQDRGRFVIGWYASRWWDGGIFHVPYAHNAICTTHRERILRERYPNAEWIDLDSF